MPASKSFLEKLEKILPEAIEKYGTPFHIYDEEGIRETGARLKKCFFSDRGFQEFFAVKALPNPAILRIMAEMGFGFDCSSLPEIELVQKIDGLPHDIIFTSNNTSREELEIALKTKKCILNLDDEIFLDKLPYMPELICFRYNPGSKREGNVIIGKPEEAKYGVPHDKIVKVYRQARDLGAKKFGLHTMLISNQLDYTYMVETVRMLLEVVAMISKNLGIKFEFINMGGGLGIPYRPSDLSLNLKKMSEEISELLSQFKNKYGYCPKLWMESGRYMTGPHGVLVTRVINKMRKYRNYIGVDACMSSLMRPAIYGAYHHIIVLGKKDFSNQEIVDVVGSLCENNDKFAIQRELPMINEGDTLLIHDTGAHGWAMGFNYNGRLRPKELLLKTDGAVVMIRRAETNNDYFSTLNF